MLLIFDCDGVILDSMLLHTEVESEAYRKFGIEITPRELSRRFAGVPLIEEFEILEREHGRKLPSGLEHEISAAKKQVFAQRLRAMTGIEDALKQLDDVPRCVASGMMIGELQHSLKIVNLYESFAPHIYSSDMVRKGKPAPDLFLYAAEQMNVAPEQCLVIEDGVAGVQAALAAGMRALGFVGGCHCDEEHARRLSSAGSKTIFKEMRELPGLVRGL